MPSVRVVIGVEKLSKLDQLDWDSWSAADEIASAMETKSVDEGVTFLNGPITTDFAASIFNSSNLTADKAASILNSIAVDRIADIFNSSNILGARVKNILSSSSISADRTQEILYKMFDKGYHDKLIEILASAGSSSEITADTTITDGVSIYNELTVDSGVTLTVGAPPGVIIANTITNNGTIKSGWVKAAGGSTQYDSSHGGDGAGGLILLAKTLSIGTISADGYDGEERADTIPEGNGSGADGEPGFFWVISPDSPPLGGLGGGGSDFGQVAHVNGGGGGCNDETYMGGESGNGSYRVFDTTNDLLSELFESVIDWWIENILSKTPTTTKSIPSLGGSGGGGGYDYRFSSTAGHRGGNGGGGAGEIIVYGTSITAGTLTAKGGNGELGTKVNIAGAIPGGGGAGGGVIYVFYKSLSGTNTFGVSGGSGVGEVPSTSGEDGGTGVAKEVAV